MSWKTSLPEPAGRVTPPCRHFCPGCGDPIQLVEKISLGMYTAPCGGELLVVRAALRRCAERIGSPCRLFLSCQFRGATLFLLYADESGTPTGPDQDHFVLAGVSVFERQVHWLSLELDKIAAQFLPSDPNSVELHGVAMYGGRGFWRRVERSKRIHAMKETLQLIDGKRCRIFASVVKKSAISPEDPVRYTFQQLASRCDHFLAREHDTFNNTQRGLIIFDKSAEEGPIQALCRDFKTKGHDFGTLRNMADVPVFIDSQATRMIQLADLVAYALFRFYERGDSQFRDIIERKLDYFGGTKHGLHEKL